MVEIFKALHVLKDYCQCEQGKCNPQCVFYNHGDLRSATGERISQPCLISGCIPHYWQTPNALLEKLQKDIIYLEQVEEKEDKEIDHSESKD